MNIGKSEAQREENRRLIGGAFLKLLGEKPSSHITIKEICDEAGVSRNDFYREYKTKGDVLCDWVDKTMAQYGESAGLREGETHHTSREELAKVFHTFREHEVFLLACENANIGQYVKDVFTAYLRENFINQSKGTKGSRRRGLLVSLYASAVYGAAIDWLQDGAKESPEEMADILYAVYGEHI